ncbi:cytochrome P450 [Mycena polygramma]|nr:cytochrome P450 [Mycena polygramma]
MLGAVIVFATVTWTFYRWHASGQLIIQRLPGPPSLSWIYGNLPQLLLSEEYGEYEFQWQESYGQVYPIKGCFGESRLMISDPVAVKYILNQPFFAIGAALQKATNFVLGPGNVFSASGDRQRYLRNIFIPCFSSAKVRASRPIIRENARKLVDRWEALGFPGNTIDISKTVREAVQDVFGECILEHSFNALAGQNEVGKNQGALVDSSSNATTIDHLVDFAFPYIPDRALCLAWSLPLRAMRMTQQYQRETDKLSRDLVQQKRVVGSDDTFIGRLIRPNPYDTGVGVPDEDIPVHLRTFLISTEDTVALTTGWVLYHLGKMQDLQQALREEIKRASSDGVDGPDYDNMSLLNAVINEVLRLYPAFPLAERTATEDCVLPLSEPLTTTDGVRISELPIKKGQRLYVAIASYHRLSSVWGPDAQEFRPSRWLEKEPCKGPALGPHASLLTFLGGHGVCPGWRLAISEIQVLVTELIQKFVVTIPEDASLAVKPRVTTTLAPRTPNGVQRLPLHIEPVM